MRVLTPEQASARRLLHLAATALRAQVTEPSDDPGVLRLEVPATLEQYTQARELRVTLDKQAALLDPVTCWPPTRAWPSC